MTVAVKARELGDLASRSLVVPPVDAEPWPTLGPQVCDFIEDHLVHGPGDLLGDPVELTDEMRLLIYRAYEVYPRGHEYEGRRRFKRVCYSRRKGAAKTELDAWLAITELDPEGPVRFGGWDATGDPVGVPVRDPYIPLVATTEEQSDELAYGAAYEILLACDLGNSYDVGVDRITPRDAPGKMVSLAAAPRARDGARTTFQVFDETHLFVMERLKQAHATMLMNVPKRRAADAWSLESTTMYEPGEDSIAQRTHEYALDVATGRLADVNLYFDHRQAALHWDISRRGQLRQAIEEASGDAIAWADVPAIVDQFFEHGADKPRLRRFWLNQRVKGSGRWIAPDVYERLVAERRRPKAGATIVLGFDGSESRDSTALVGCTIEERPRIWIEGVWERPLSTRQAWRVSHTAVDAAIEAAYQRYDVRELAPDPPGWRKEIEEWIERHGEKNVVVFDTNQPSRMGPAADEFLQAAKDKAFSLVGEEPMLRHLGHCVGHLRAGYTIPGKITRESTDTVDVATAAILAYTRALWHFQHPPVVSSWRAY